MHTDADIDDVGVATLEFDSGALGVLTGSYVSPHTFAVRLQGTEGVLDYRADLGAVWPDAERVDEVSTVTVDGEPVAFERARHARRGAARARRWRCAATPWSRPARDEGIAALRVILEAVGG